MAPRKNDFEKNVPAGEPGKSHQRRLASGMISKYLSGDVVLDIGAGNGPAVTPDATIIDLNTPGYDGFNLPYPDESVDSIFSSHCLEHVFSPIDTLREWFRATKVGGYLFITVPHQFLYEKKAFPPSRWNGDHKRFFTPANLLSLIEKSFLPNTYRIREMRDVDEKFNYEIDINAHSQGCYEIEVVLEKISPPNWSDFTYSKLLHDLAADNIHSVVVCGTGEIGKNLAKALMLHGYTIELFTDRRNDSVFMDVNGIEIAICKINDALANKKNIFVIASQAYASEIKNEILSLAPVDLDCKIYTID